jgi:hypothetical protein
VTDPVHEIIWRDEPAPPAGLLRHSHPDRRMSGRRASDAREFSASNGWPKYARLGKILGAERELGPTSLSGRNGHESIPSSAAGAFQVEVNRLRRPHGSLDHLISWGGNGMLLGPIFTSRSHGYDTIDYYQIDPRLGDDADFDALVAACRGGGMRLLLSDSRPTTVVLSSAMLSRARSA